MDLTSNAASVFLVLLTSGLLVFTGLRKQPGIGILGTIVIIALTLWLRGESLDALGFDRPASWGAAVGLGLLLGLVIQLLSVALFEPLIERITNTAHDHSLVEGVRGNWRAFLQWMLIVWLTVAVLEEGIYRGFLMTEVAGVLGDGSGALALNILFTSIVFGLSHGYQGRSGMLSTGIVSIFLGAIFVWSGFNLWLAIFAHGFIDTVGIGLIAMDGDRAIRRWLWRSRE